MQRPEGREKVKWYTQPKLRKPLGPYIARRIDAKIIPCDQNHCTGQSNGSPDQSLSYVRQLQRKYQIQRNRVSLTVSTKGQHKAHMMDTQKCYIDSFTIAKNDL